MDVTQGAAGTRKSGTDVPAMSVNVTSWLLYALPPAREYQLILGEYALHNTSG